MNLETTENNRGSCPVGLRQIVLRKWKRRSASFFGDYPPALTQATLLGPRKEKKEQQRICSRKSLRSLRVQGITAIIRGQMQSATVTKANGLRRPGRQGRGESVVVLPVLRT
jgi:hypothetical protein